MSEIAEALAVYAQRIMDLDAKEAKAQDRIKQLEVGHDEWRTHAHRAEAEVTRLKRLLGNTELEVRMLREACALLNADVLRLMERAEKTPNYTMDPEDERLA